jgi:hypothetical protein
LWILVVLAAGVGALVLGLDRNWTGFILFAVATLLATVQLIRIRLRAVRAGGDGGRRW